jgi:7-cyano-7-deazaguanine synthase in queuosine biosynthesis
MIGIKASKSGSSVSYSLEPLGAEGRGNFEWSAHLPPAVNDDPIAEDLLRVGQAIYLADRAVRRSAGVGDPLREINVTIPVAERRRLAAVGPMFERLAEFATCDQWRIRFKGLASGGAKRNSRRSPRPEPIDVVSLFSGGLDSLCGAAHVASSGLRPVFVTHSPPGRENTQSLVGDVFADLGRDRPGGAAFAAYRLETREANSAGQRTMFAEHTRRSRPFYFLSLAASTAVRVDAPRVWMTENGALALSLPIRANTHGPFMARQAHSFLLHGFAEILAALLKDRPIIIDNPFVRKTKGEACLELKTAGRHSPRAWSCEYTGRQRAVIQRWRREHPRQKRDVGDGPQCGLCIPCLVRRAALHRARIEDPPSLYFADAPAVMRLVSQREGKAVDVFGSNAPPPLLNTIATNIVHLPRFCETLLSMKVDDFGTRYLPELRANRDLHSGAAPSVRESFDLMKRFGQEILDFVHDR